MQPSLFLEKDFSRLDYCSQFFTPSCLVTLQCLKVKVFTFSTPIIMSFVMRLYKQLMELTTYWFLAKALRQGKLKFGPPGKKHALVILVAAGPRRTWWHINQPEPNLQPTVWTLRSGILPSLVIQPQKEREKHIVLSHWIFVSFFFFYAALWP